MYYIFKTNTFNLDGLKILCLAFYVLKFMTTSVSFCY